MEIKFSYKSYENKKIIRTKIKKYLWIIPYWLTVEQHVYRKYSTLWLHFIVWHGQEFNIGQPIKNFDLETEFEFITTNYRAVHTAKNVDFLIENKLRGEL